MTHKNLCEELRDARKSLGIAQQKIADLTGVAQVQVCHWENLQRRPRLDLFVAWAAALGYEVVLLPKATP